ncbi:hypothetical protein Ae201684P_008070 [Aphanomyces euteiches]|nr:hypothetical protein Ae201684P_008070 [Aphanomyces euteiches]KAH9145480.1 hypothetical protein AeRB84_010611 [Aphanomyces euteiches]
MNNEEDGELQYLLRSMQNMSKKKNVKAGVVKQAKPTSGSFKKPTVAQTTTAFNDKQPGNLSFVQQLQVKYTEVKHALDVQHAQCEDLRQCVAQLVQEKAQMAIQSEQLHNHIESRDKEIKTLRAHVQDLYDVQQQLRADKLQTDIQLQKALQFVPNDDGAVCVCHSNAPVIAWHSHEETVVENIALDTSLVQSLRDEIKILEEQVLRQASELANAHQAIVADASRVREMEEAMMQWLTILAPLDPNLDNQEDEVNLTSTIATISTTVGYLVDSFSQSQATSTSQRSRIRLADDPTMPEWLVQALSNVEETMDDASHALDMDVLHMELAALRRSLERKDDEIDAFERMVESMQGELGILKTHHDIHNMRSSSIASTSTNEPEDADDNFNPELDQRLASSEREPQQLRHTLEVCGQETKSQNRHLASIEKITQTRPFQTTTEFVKSTQDLVVQGSPNDIINSAKLQNEWLEMLAEDFVMVYDHCRAKCSQVQESNKICQALHLSVSRLEGIAKEAEEQRKHVIEENSSLLQEMTDVKSHHDESNTMLQNIICTTKVAWQADIETHRQNLELIIQEHNQDLAIKEDYFDELQNKIKHMQTCMDTLQAAVNETTCAKKRAEDSNLHLANQIYLLEDELTAAISQGQSLVEITKMQHEDYFTRAAVALELHTSRALDLEETLQNAIQRLESSLGDLQSKMDAVTDSEQLMYLENEHLRTKVTRMTRDLIDAQDYAKMMRELQQTLQQDVELWKMQYSQCRSNEASMIELNTKLAHDLEQIERDSAEWQEQAADLIEMQRNDYETRLEITNETFKEKIVSMMDKLEALRQQILQLESNATIKDREITAAERAKFIVEEANTKLSSQLNEVSKKLHDTTNYLNARMQVSGNREQMLLGEVSAWKFHCFELRSREADLVKLNGQLTDDFKREQEESRLKQKQTAEIKALLEEDFAMQLLNTIESHRETVKCLLQAQTKLEMKMKCMEITIAEVSGRLDEEQLAKNVTERTCETTLVELQEAKTELSLMYDGLNNKQIELESWRAKYVESRDNEAAMRELNNILSQGIKQMQEDIAAWQDQAADVIEMQQQDHEARILLIHEQHTTKMSNLAQSEGKLQCEIERLESVVQILRHKIDEMVDAKISVDTKNKSIESKLTQVTVQLVESRNHAKLLQDREENLKCLAKSWEDQYCSNEYIVKSQLVNLNVMLEEEYGVRLASANKSFDQLLEKMTRTEKSLREKALQLKTSMGAMRGTMTRTIEENLALNANIVELRASLDETRFQTMNMQLKLQKEADSWKSECLASRNNEAAAKLFHEQAVLKIHQDYALLQRINMERLEMLHEDHAMRQEKKEISYKNDMLSASNQIDKLQQQVALEMSSKETAMSNAKKWQVEAAELATARDRSIHENYIFLSAELSKLFSPAKHGAISKKDNHRPSQLPGNPATHEAQDACTINSRDFGNLMTTADNIEANTSVGDFAQLHQEAESEQNDSSEQYVMEATDKVVTGHLVHGEPNKGSETANFMVLVQPLIKNLEAYLGDEQRRYTKQLQDIDEQYMKNKSFLDAQIQTQHQELDHFRDQCANYEELNRKHEAEKLLLSQSIEALEDQLGRLQIELENKQNKITKLEFAVVSAENNVDTSLELQHASLLEVAAYRSECEHLKTLVDEMNSRMSEFKRERLEREEVLVSSMQEELRTLETTYKNQVAHWKQVALTNESQIIKWKHVVGSTQLEMHEYQTRQSTKDSFVCGHSMPDPSPNRRIDLNVKWLHALRSAQLEMDMYKELSTFELKKAMESFTKRLAESTAYLTLEHNRIVAELAERLCSEQKLTARISNDLAMSMEKSRAMSNEIEALKVEHDDLHRRCKENDQKFDKARLEWIHQLRAVQLEMDCLQDSKLQQDQQFDGLVEENHRLQCHVEDIISNFHESNVASSRQKKISDEEWQRRIQALEYEVVAAKRASHAAKIESGEVVDKLRKLNVEHSRLRKSHKDLLVDYGAISGLIDGLVCTTTSWRQYAQTIQLASPAYPHEPHVESGSPKDSKMDSKIISSPEIVRREAHPSSIPAVVNSMECGRIDDCNRNVVEMMAPSPYHQVELNIAHELDVSAMPELEWMWHAHESAKQIDMVQDKPLISPRRLSPEETRRQQMLEAINEQLHQCQDIHSQEISLLEAQLLNAETEIQSLQESIVHLNQTNKSYKVEFRHLQQRFLSMHLLTRLQTKSYPLASHVEPTLFGLHQALFAPSTSSSPPLPVNTQGFETVPEENIEAKTLLRDPMHFGLDRALFAHSAKPSSSPSENIYVLETAPEGQIDDITLMWEPTTYGLDKVLFAPSASSSLPSSNDYFMLATIPEVTTDASNFMWAPTISGLDQALFASTASLPLESSFEIDELTSDAQGNTNTWRLAWEQTMHGLDRALFASSASLSLDSSVDIDGEGKTDAGKMIWEPTTQGLDQALFASSALSSPLSSVDFRGLVPIPEERDVIVLTSDSLSGHFAALLQEMHQVCDHLRRCRWSRSDLFARIQSRLKICFPRPNIYSNRDIALGQASELIHTFVALWVESLHHRTPSRGLHDADRNDAVASKSLNMLPKYQRRQRRRGRAKELSPAECSGVMLLHVGATEIQAGILGLPMPLVNLPSPRGLFSKGHLVDIDRFEAAVDSAFCQLGIHPPSYKVVLLHKPTFDSTDKETLTDLFLDGFGVYGLNLTTHAQVCLLGRDLHTGLVVDFGTDSTCIVPIFEDMLLDHALVTIRLGSADIVKCFTTTKAGDMVSTSSSSLLDHPQAPIDLVEAIHACVSKCDPVLHKALYNSIVVTGGPSALPGLASRLERDLNVAVVHVEPFVFQGASLHATHLSPYKWVLKPDYVAHGARIVHAKCF